MPADTYPDFHQLDAILSRSQALAGAAESHGILCGLYCAEGKPDQDTWLKHVLGEVPAEDEVAAEARALLTQVHDATMAQLAAGDFSLRLLLRDDDDPLTARIEDLAHWCQGFLVGLSLGGITDIEKMPEDAREITEDLLQISRAHFDPEEEAPEEGETVYAEVVEYVRMGVFVVFSELNPESPLDQGEPAIH